MTLAECEKAVDELGSPDQYSRSQEEGGRRIVKVNGGWKVVNHFKYRDEVENQRDYWRRKKAEERSKKKDKSDYQIDKREDPEGHTMQEKGVF